MHYYTQKMIEQRLARAARAHRNAAFVRELRALPRTNGRGALGNVLCQLATWTPLLSCREIGTMPQSQLCATTTSSETEGRWQW